MAVRAPPTCRNPVGDGAKRSFIGRKAIGRKSLARPSRYNRVVTRQRGFSLIEVLAALLILGLVITTTLAVFIERTRRLRQAAETLLAYQALANETEVRRRLNFAALDASSPTFLSDTTILAPLAPFTTSVAITQTSPELKNVVMSIQWSGGKRVAKLSIVRADTGGTNLW
jgi:prepilin-type N-terminal cleavage/methylation domain-containing protein